MVSKPRPFLVLRTIVLMPLVGRSLYGNLYLAPCHKIVGVIQEMKVRSN